MAQALRIGQLAKATGVAAKTIRYYEEVGVLPSPNRTGAGYRQYDQPSVGRLLFLRRARALGLSLQHLKALTAILDGGPRLAMRPRLRALVRGQVSTVQQQIAELRLLKGQLEGVLQRLRTPGRGDDGRGCRCLEIESIPARQAGRRGRRR